MITTKAITRTTIKITIVTEAISKRTTKSITGTTTKTRRTLDCCAIKKRCRTDNPKTNTACALKTIAIQTELLSASVKCMRKE